MSNLLTTILLDRLLRQTFHQQVEFIHIFQLKLFGINKIVGSESCFIDTIADVEMLVVGVIAGDESCFFYRCDSGR